MPEQRPTRRGFDEFFGFLGGANSYLPPTVAPQYNIVKDQAEGKGAQRLKAQADRAAVVGASATNAEQDRAERLVERAANGADDEGPTPGARRQAPDVVPNILRGDVPANEREYLTDAFGREASAFVERHKAEPFYLQITSNAPHGPQPATPKYLDRFANIENPTRRTYAAQVSALNDAVGRVLTTLRDTKQEENTLIFFFSDNGGPLGDHWNGSNNDPLSGNKGDVLEGGIRVPFLVQWNGRIPAGKVDARPVIQLDILPTALAAAGAVVPPTQTPDAPREGAVDGVNLLPFLEGKTGNPHEALFWRFNRGRTPGQFQWAIRQGDVKVLQTRQQEARIVNLASDFKELRDLTLAETAQRAKLQEQWTRWNATLQEPAWQIAAAKACNAATKTLGVPAATATVGGDKITRKDGQPRRVRAEGDRPLTAKQQAKRAARRAAKETKTPETAPVQP